MTTERPRDQAPETGETAEAGKKSLIAKLKLPLIILVVLVVLGVAALVALPKLTSSKGKDTATPAEPSAKSDEASAESKGLGVLFPLDPFIINLLDPAGKRYLKVRIELELSSKDLEAQVKERMPQIKDGLLILLSSKTYEEIETVEGKLRLRQEIVARINSFLTSGRVQNIYFTEFVVQ